MAIRKCLVVVTLCAMFGAIVLAQDANQAAPAMDNAQKAALIKNFTRSMKMDGIIFSFVLLNDKTVEALFSGSGKYAVRARANMATTFYVQGVSEKDMNIDPRFVVEQDGKTFAADAIDIRNLKAGPVTKGSRVEGLVQLSQKINVAQPFKIKGAQDGSTDFKLSAEAIKLLAN